MKKWFKQFLLSVHSLSAWEREEILDAVEAMYQAKRREIIIQTIIITTVIISIIAGLIVKYFIL